jgi:4a-hydroxytetrahydrobiopterin dehydratase
MGTLLTDEQISDALQELDGWERDGNAIKRKVKLASFPAAIEVVRQVAEIAEARDHHPDIDIRWRSLTFRCTTHSEGGLTSRDFALAREINSVLSSSS